MDAFNEREILLRLNKLEKRLSDKDCVIDRLNSKVKNLETELKQLKSDRVAAIDSLKQKISSIETQLHELVIPTTPPASASDSPPDSDTPSATPAAAVLLLYRIVALGLSL